MWERERLAVGVLPTRCQGTRCLKGEGEQPQVVVHIGTNDIGKSRDGDLKQEFRELGWKLRARTNHVVISGLLPVPRASELRNRESADKHVAPGMV